MVVQSGGHLLARQGFARLSLYGVRYLITHLPLQEEGFDPLGGYPPGAHLYENRNVRPRAFAVPTYNVAGDVADSLNHMVSPTFDPAREVVLFVAPAEHEGAPDASGFASKVEIVRDEPLHVTVEAELNQPGFLVLSDLDYPGWEAGVDGTPVTIYFCQHCRQT